MNQSLPQSANPPGLPAWLTDPRLRTWALSRGTIAFAIALGLSLVLTVLATTALTSGLEAAFSSVYGSGPGSPATSLGSSSGAGDATSAYFLAVLSFFFFQNNLGPYDAAVSLIGITLFGFGSLLITGAVVVYAFRAGRALQRTDPLDAGLIAVAFRASLLAVPYWVGSLFIFLLGTVHATLPFVGPVVAGPSGLGLVTVYAIPGGAAAAGALHVRLREGSATARAILRGIAIAIVSIVLGVIGSLMGLIVASLFGLATHSLPSTPSSSSNSGSATANGGSAGTVFLISVIVLGIVYLVNSLFLLWGSTLDAAVLKINALGILAILMGLGGAVMGSLLLQWREGHVEQATYAIALGVLSFLMTVVASPVAGTVFAQLPSPVIPLLVGLVVGSVLAYGGPILSKTQFGVAVLALAPMAGLANWLPATDGAAATGWVSPVPNTWDSLPASVHREVATRTEDGPPAAPSLRLGRNVYVALGVIVALIVLAVGANAFVSSQVTPESVVASYFKASNANDADGLWSAILVAQPPTGPGQAQLGQPQQGQPQSVISLTGKSDLLATLQQSENRKGTASNLEISNAVISGDQATVVVRYMESGQQRSAQLLLEKTSQKRYLLYPDWRVVVPPVLISWSLPTPDSKVSVDGIPVAGQQAWTFPWIHHVSLASNGLFASTTKVVDAGAMNLQPVQFPLDLTANAKTAAATSIKTYFANCAARASGAPDNCPQGVNDYNASNVHWTLVGDPSSGFDIAVQAQGFFGQSQAPQVVAQGHYLMSVVYDASFSGGTRHRFSGGDYALALTWDGSKFSANPAGYLGRNAKPLARPTVTDEVVRAAVSAAFQACAKITDPSGSPDCPMSDYVYGGATNQSWSLVGDPLAGATVGFDENSGVLTVDGSYTMHFTYDSSFSGHQVDVRQGNYKAYVIWDGQKATVLYIQ